MRRFTVAAIVCLTLLITVPMRCHPQRIVHAPPRAAGQSQPSDPFKPHLPPRAAAYHRASRVLFFLSIAWRILGLVVYLRTGASAAARDRAESLARRLRNRGREPTSESVRGESFVAVAVFYVAFTLFTTLWSLPVAVAGLAIERTFGFSHETDGLFLQDTVVNLGVAWLMIPVIWLAYAIHARWPRQWWLILWAAMAPITVFVMIVYPLAILPLYNHYTPLKPGPLRDDILALAAKAGIQGGRVFVEDTSRRTAHVNAYVIGIGPSTRIVLNDTALQELPQDQILAMMGHEMGHYVEHHVVIGVAAGILGTGLLLGLLAALVPRLAARFGRAWLISGPGDLGALPLVALCILLLSFLGEPIANAISRTIEHRADAFGLRLTGLNDATARLMVGFAERDLSDPDPPLLLHLWFGSHPTLSERIAFARHYRARRER